MTVKNLFAADVRVYIAGILMPCISINITTSVSAYSSCTLSVDPDPRLFGLGRWDRVPVHIFFRNSMTESDEFILIFEGEVSGSGYFNNSYGREFAINAHSHFSFLKDFNVKIINSLRDFADNNMPSEVMIHGSVAQSSLVFPYSLFMYGLGSVSKDNVISTPTQFLDSVYNFLMENYDNKAFPPSLLAHYYKAYATLLRFGNRYTGLPFFDDKGYNWGGYSNTNIFPLLSGIQKATALELVADMSGAGPHTDSIYNFINFIVANMEYEFAFFNSPKYSDDKLISFCLKPLLHDALPPECNILYRPLIESISANEQALMPTRLRTVDVHGTWNIATKGDQAPEHKIGSYNVFPNNMEGQDSKVSDEVIDRITNEILKTEQYTGPRLIELSAPMWFSHVKDIEKEPNIVLLKQRTLASLYQLSVYQTRTATVNCAFNPYVTVGFPCVAYDTEDPKITFIGYALSVNHNISKRAVRTRIDLGFVRTLQEEQRAPLFNAFKPISEQVTRNKEAIDKIYNTIIGCNSVDLASLVEMQDKAIHMQSNVLDAYKWCSRSIVTFEEYCKFMKIGTSDVRTDSNGDSVPHLLTTASRYFEARNSLPATDQKVRSVLQAVSDELYNNRIYN